MSNPALADNPRLLVDGDIVAYRCAAAAEKTKYCVTVSVAHGHEPYFALFDTAKEAKAYAEYHSDGGCSDIYIWSRKDLQPVENAIQMVNTTLEAIIKRFPKGTVEVYLSGERNFRDNVWVTKKYKGQRTTPKPTHLEDLRSYLISRWDAVVSQNQEADDDIGINSRLGETIVVSTDKDLDQIPGWHYNWVKEEVYHVSQYDADMFLWEQVISGDATDNIPGLPGLGPAKARKYMDAWDMSVPCEEYVYALYREQGFGYEYFHEMVTLIKILKESR